MQAEMLVRTGAVRGVELRGSGALRLCERSSGVRNWTGFDGRAARRVLDFLDTRIALLLLATLSVAAGSNAPTVEEFEKAAAVTGSCPAGIRRRWRPPGRGSAEASHTAGAPCDHYTTAT